MTQLFRGRFLAAIYTVVLVLGALSIWVAHEQASEFVKATLLNLGTELLGVVLVFFIVDTLFLRKEWELSDRVDELIEQLNTNERQSAMKFFTGSSDIGPLIHNAAEIDLCGISLTSTINRQLTAIRDGVRSGKRFRIMLVDPGIKGEQSVALKSAGARSEIGDASYYETRLTATFMDLQFLYERVGPGGSDPMPIQGGGSLEIRLLTYAPGIGMAGFRAPGTRGRLFVEIYPYHTGYGNPPVFVVTETLDGHWYEHFREQFEAMWSRATPWPRPAPSPMLQQIKAVLGTDSRSRQEGTDHKSTSAPA